MIIDTYDGGPVGIEALAATLSEEQATLVEVVEPYCCRSASCAHADRPQGPLPRLPAPGLSLPRMEGDQGRLGVRGVKSGESNVKRSNVKRHPTYYPLTFDILTSPRFVPRPPRASPEFPVSPELFAARLVHDGVVVMPFGVAVHEEDSSGASHVLLGGVGVDRDVAAPIEGINDDLTGQGRLDASWGT